MFEGPAILALARSGKVRALATSGRERAQAAPELPRGLLLETREVDWRETATRLGCKAIHPKWSELSAEWIAEIHKAGFACLTWTVNDPVAAKRLLDWGVDALITDVPDVASALLTRRRAGPAARMSTDLGLVPPMTRPAMRTSLPVPTTPRVEKLRL